MRASDHFQTKRKFKALWLLVILLAGCRPTAGSPAATLQPAATMNTTTFQSSVSTEMATLTPDMVDVTPVATSRGPNLVASDPAKVNLSVGRLQLVEFFRFT